MPIKLEPKWTKVLTALPENGMGYQRVSVQLDSGRKFEDVPVFNAEELDLPEDLAGEHIVDISLIPKR